MNKYIINGCIMSLFLALYPINMEATDINNKKLEPWRNSASLVQPPAPEQIILKFLEKNQSFTENEIERHIQIKFLPTIFNPKFYKATVDEIKKNNKIFKKQDNISPFSDAILKFSGSLLEGRSVFSTSRNLSRQIDKESSEQKINNNIKYHNNLSAIMTIFENDFKNTNDPNSLNLYKIFDSEFQEWRKKKLNNPFITLKKEKYNFSTDLFQEIFNSTNKSYYSSLDSFRRFFQQCETGNRAILLETNPPQAKSKKLLKNILKGAAMPKKKRRSSAPLQPVFRSPQDGLIDQIPALDQKSQGITVTPISQKSPSPRHRAKRVTQRLKPFITKPQEFQETNQRKCRAKDACPNILGHFIHGYLDDDASGIIPANGNILPVDNNSLATVRYRAPHT